LLNLADENRLLKAINPRSTGSDMDKAKLAEKVGGALRRLARIGIITRIGEQNSRKFIISESVFRFGAEVRAGDDPREAQLRLIRDGEATTPDFLAAQAVEMAENSVNNENSDDLDDTVEE
jgi:chromosome partition protein MukE